jgi:hypothetical protein
VTEAITVQSTTLISSQESSPGRVVATHIDVGLIGVATTRKGELSWEEISVVDWTVMASVTPHRSLAGKTKAVFRSLVQAASDDAGGSASK